MKKVVFRISTYLILFAGLASCTPAEAPVVVQIPTVAETAVSLPSITPSPTITPTNPATPTLAPTFTPIPTNTPIPSPTATPTATATPFGATAPPPTNTPIPPPLPTPQDGISQTLRVPILMYHYVSTPPEDADVYRVDLSVEPDRFAEQLAYLAANGFQTIDFYDLSRAVTMQQQLPPKPVILTFDDGYLDNYTTAFPLLEQYGFKGTFFIVTEFVDREREGYMTWWMIREIAQAGHRIEPHSRTHPDLSLQEREELIWQTLGPQETIAFHIGYTPRYFSYPSGRYNEEVITILQELNFWGAVTTWSGKEHGYADRFEWTRLRVRNNTPLPEFVDLVEPRR